MTDPTNDTAGADHLARVRANRWRDAQADVPAEFGDHDLLRAVAAAANRTAKEAASTRVAAQWAAIGVWVVALAVLAGLFGLVTLEFEVL